MATMLTKAIRREVDGIDRNGVIVTLYPNHTIGLRAKRTRKEHVLPLARVYRWAVEATVEQQRQQRAESRRQRLIAQGKTPQDAGPSARAEGPGPGHRRQPELAAAMTLKWHRVRPGFYTAGPWILKRYPYHRAVWELRKFTLRGGTTPEHIGNFDTAARAKTHAADQEQGQAR